MSTVPLFGRHLAVIVLSLYSVGTTNLMADEPASPSAAPSLNTPSAELGTASIPSPTAEGSGADEGAGAIAPVMTAPTNAVAAENDALTQATFSMQLQNAPLLQMLTILGTTSPVRFRYATPPDATVTTTLQDAPLLSTLENLMHSVGFTTRRDGLDLFVIKPGADLPVGGAAEVQPVSWQVWTRRVPPPARWMVPPPPPSWPRPGTKDKWQMEKNLATAAIGVAWQPALLEFNAKRRPGVTVQANRAVASELTASDTMYLRWTVNLRRVPRGAQLLLESPHEITLYVNGAPLLRRLRSTRLVDLAEVLQPGENTLAITLRRIKLVPQTAGTGESGGHGESGQIDAEKNNVHEEAGGVGKGDVLAVESPLLYYEWFFGGDDS